MALTQLSQYYSRCLHPRRVRNRYTHEVVVASCGHCDACLKAKSNRYVSLCNAMSEVSKSVFFITLTYDQIHLPTACFTKHSNFVDVTTSYDDSYKGLCCPMSLTDEHFFNLGMPSLSDSSFLGKGKFGVLVKSDLQKFFKRLRKHISYALPSLLIKYFACGEYGSRTFRPHFHAVVFCSAPVSASIFSSLVRLSWKSGIIDVQRVAANAASYVASYLSSATSLPVFLQLKEFKPFVVHSAFSSISFNQDGQKKVLERTYRENSPLSVETNSDGCSVFPLPSTVRHFCYPVPTRFSERNDGEVYSFLCKYAKAAEQQQTDNPRFLVDVAVGPLFATHEELAKLGYDDEHKMIVEKQYLTLAEIRDAYLRLDSERKKNDSTVLCIKDVYTNLYASYRVWKIATLLGIGVRSVVRNILQFYRGSAEQPYNYELYLLSCQYQSQEECDNIDDVQYLCTFYNESSASSALQSCGFDSDFAQSKNFDDAFNRFLNVVSNSNIKVIKHKDRNSYLQYSQHHV